MAQHPALPSLARALTAAGLALTLVACDKPVTPEDAAKAGAKATTGQTAQAARALAGEGQGGAPAEGAVQVAGEPMPNWAEAFKYTARWDAATKAVVVDLDIAPGFHAYTTGETIGKPLVVELAAESDFVLASDVKYPTGVTKDLPLGRSVIVEGKSAIVAEVKAKAAATGDAKGTLRYQVCTEKACDRPRTVPFTVAVAN
jgi:hypothetical protein